MMAKKKIDIIDVKKAVEDGEIEVIVVWTRPIWDRCSVRVMLKDKSTDEVVKIKEFSASTRTL
jgi:hypothetical protein